MTNETKTDPREDLLKQFEKRRYNPEYTPAPDHRILTVGDKVVGSLQNYVVFSGLPKAGKSTFVAAAAASAIHPGEMFNIKINLPDNRKRICYIDTESSDYDFHRQMERIKKFSLRTSLPDNFDAFAVREDAPNTIKKYIDNYIELYEDCSVVIIDGLLDLILYFNDELESRKLVNWLKKITKVNNILIIVVLHLGKKDGMTLGHLGSMTDRYAVSTLEVVKDKEQQAFILQSKFMRSDADFEPIALKNYDGNFYQIEYEPTPKQNFKQSKNNKKS